MSKLHTIPKADGFHMPAEYAPHHGTIMIFPERRGSWSNVPKAQEIFSCIIREIAKSETVYVLVSEAQRTRAWGGEFDGLYAHWEEDNALACRFCESIGLDCYDAQHFVLEGGSIHSDGEGTVLVTESCLLSP